MRVKKATPASSTLNCSIKVETDVAKIKQKGEIDCLMPFQFLDTFKGNTSNILLNTCMYNLHIAHIWVLGSHVILSETPDTNFQLIHNMNKLNIYEQTSALLGFTLQATSWRDRKQEVGAGRKGHWFYVSMKVTGFQCSRLALLLVLGWKKGKREEGEIL